MLDRRLDEQLVNLNKRYQMLLHSETNSKGIKTERYTSNIKKMAFKQIIKDLQYREYAKKHFSTKGNIIQEECERKDISTAKIAVYSCIIGAYDSVIEPVYKEEGIDYFLYTDQDIPSNSSWQKKDVTKMEQYKCISPAMMNRSIKILQTEELLKYDYTLYVDGNIEVVAGITPIIEKMGDKGLGVHYHRSRDCIYDEVVAVKHLKHIEGREMDRQLLQYRQEGFPIHYGLYENSILVRNNRHEKVLSLMGKWWDEYLRFPTRDQLSLPYVVWKYGFDKAQILILGNDVEMNPRFNRYYSHRK